jgi:ATP-dependent DNA ligase
MVYYYPNRPTLIPPDPENPLEPGPWYLNDLEASGKYVAELKWNGDNTLLHTDTMTLWNRKHEKLKYQPSPEVAEELRLWKEAAGDAIINFETVHTKTTEVKHTLIVHCIMAWRGEYLIGKTWGDSRNILDWCIDQGLSGEHVQISKIWKTGFWKLFQETDGKVHEGIILKNPNGKLVFSTSLIKDVPYQLKIRKPCKKYSF